MRACLDITYCLLDISLHLLTQHAFKDKGVTKLLSLKGKKEIKIQKGCSNIFHMYRFLCAP